MKHAPGSGPRSEHGSPTISVVFVPAEKNHGGSGTASPRSRLFVRLALTPRCELCTVTPTCAEPLGNRASRERLSSSQLPRGSVARPSPTGHEAPRGPLPRASTHFVRCAPSGRAACGNRPPASFRLVSRKRPLPMNPTRAHRDSSPSFPPSRGRSLQRLGGSRVVEVSPGFRSTSARPMNFRAVCTHEALELRGRTPRFPSSRMLAQ